MAKTWILPASGFTLVVLAIAANFSSFVVVEAAECEQTLIDEQRFELIRNKNYPDAYENNTCEVWKIEVQPGYVINLHLTVEALDLCSNCSCDYVEVYDGHSETKSRLLIRACRAGFKDAFYTTSNKALVYFRSDNTTHQSSADQRKQGFRVLFEEVTPRGTTINPSNIIYVDADILARVSTEQFFLNGNFLTWTNDLLDKTSQLYIDAVSFFEDVLRSTYRQANVEARAIKVVKFDRREFLESAVNGTMVSYAATLRLKVPASSYDPSLDAEIDSKLDEAIVVLHQSGNFYGMFVNGPIHDVTRLSVQTPPNDDNPPIDDSAMWMIMGSVMGLLALILTTFTL